MTKSRTRKSPHYSLPLVYGTSSFAARITYRGLGESLTKTLTS